MGEPTRPARGRRSYGHYCGLARALDTLGDRWATLIVRELLAGPRRYTDLHADLPGASTDMLAARLRDLERDGVVERRRLVPPASGSVYALTDRGHAVLPALSALAAWGADDLADRRSTDAVRAHWHALPLYRVLADHGVRGTVDVVTDQGRFHVCLDEDADGDGVYGDGAADPPADTTLTLATAVLVAICAGRLDLPGAVARGEVGWDGDPPRTEWASIMVDELGRS